MQHLLVDFTMLSVSSVICVLVNILGTQTSIWSSLIGILNPNVVISIEVFEEE